jgi:TonB family protein
VVLVVLLLGGGYYFALHLPAKERAEEAAAVALAKAEEERRLLNLRLDQERQQAEQTRLALEAQQAELARLLEEQRAEQAKRDEAEKLRLAEQVRQAEAAAAEAKRLAEELARREAEANARGGVLINSTPAGAEVLIGGESLGKTPLALRDRRVGTEQVVLRLDGYAEWTGAAEIKANDFTELAATLEAKPAAEPDSYTVGQLDRAPTPRVQASPVYPFDLRRAGITGEVVVEFIVDPAGDVIAAYSIRSSDPAFEAAAIQAVRQWKFRPGMKGGKTVNTRMRVPIAFDLNN